MQVPVVVEELAGLARAREPVTLGLPLVRGAVEHVERLSLLDEGGEPLSAQQLRPITRWSDGSLKWVRLDALVDVEAGARRELVLTEVGPVPTRAKAMTVERSATELRLVAGELEVTFPRSGDSLVSRLRRGGQPVVHEGEGLVLEMEDPDLGRHRLQLTSCSLGDEGPLCCRATLRGRLGPTLEVVARASLWADRSLLRLDLTVHNPRAAGHRGGTWDLGQGGSVLIRDLTLRGRVVGASGPLMWTDEALGPLKEEPGHWLEIYQDSSGGERWGYKTHLNRELRVPNTFRGYRVRGELPGKRGERASPTLWVGSEDGVALGATVREFWQNFPKALEARGEQLLIRLFPEQYRDLHELQGGEQKTHTIWLSAEPPGNLGWVQAPLIARSTPAYYAASGAFPGLVERNKDELEGLCELAEVAIDEVRGLAARREVIDEYGWRNFGEVWADHENIGNADPLPRVSHYNNQYDGINSALAQFARSGEARWFRLGDELARHVADIDVYRTTLDRTAFSGGLFWHTDHYSDALTSTHRCYTSRCPQAQAGPYGGGPAAEHDYAGGLATHYLMTGWLPSREAALSLGGWVLSADEPESPWLAKVLPGASGLASRTDDHTYHGPGRGAGNSIETLLDALELTGDERYLIKAEELIRRVVHPDDDREAFELRTNPEVRWSYTVMILALVRYLEVKTERGELDDRYAYAQATLVSYGRWMMEHEKLSSEKRDLLLIWTESWPAQDLRKGLILMHLARHLDDETERQAVFERGRSLFLSAQAELQEWETRTLARPLFLVMRYGYQGSHLIGHPNLPALPRVAAGDLGHPSGFLPWKGQLKVWKRALDRRLTALRR